MVVTMMNNARASSLFVGLIIILCVQLELVSGNSKSESVKILSFNIQDFGTTKIGRSSVVDVLVDIALDYDIVFVQELSDDPTNHCRIDTGPVICQYVDEINNKSESLGGNKLYDFVISRRVGEGGEAEQYVSIYNKMKLEPRESFVYPEDYAGQFARSPHCTSFSVKGYPDSTFWGVSIHTKPDDARIEIYSLANVSQYLMNEYNAKNIVLLGDFNSDQSPQWRNPEDWYPFMATLSNHSKDHFPDLKSFEWENLIDNMDTTVWGNEYCYDRLVISPQFAGFYVADSANVFYFNNMTDGGFNMSAILEQGCDYGWLDCPDTELKAALRVSDHYPVEATFSVVKSAAVAVGAAISTMGIMGLFCVMTA